MRHSIFCMRPSISIGASLIWTRSLLNREELGERDGGERGFSWRDVELARRIGGGWFNLVFYPIVGPTYFTGISYVPDKFFKASVTY
jgi:hypothetical protein